MIYHDLPPVWRNPMDERDLATASKVLGELMHAAERRYGEPVHLTIDQVTCEWFFYVRSGYTRRAFPTLESAWMNLVGPVESEMDIPGVRT